MKTGILKNSLKVKFKKNKFKKNEVSEIKVLKIIQKLWFSKIICTSGKHVYMGLGWNGKWSLDYTTKTLIMTYGGCQLWKVSKLGINKTWTRAH